MLDVRTAMSHQLAELYLSQVLERIRATVAYIPPAKGDELLVDIGCWGPVLGPVHTLRGYKRLGAVAKDDWGPCDSVVLPGWAKERGIDLSVWFGDVERQPLPWADQEADVVLMLEILEHFAVDPMFVLVEANRILKPGGTLVVSTPNAASENALVRLIAGKNPYLGLEYNGVESNRHNRLYDPDELNELLKCAGFSHVEVTTIPGGTRTHLGYRSDILRLCVRLFQRRKVAKQSGDILLAYAVKTSPPLERYPGFLYVDRKLFSDWYKATGSPANACSEPRPASGAQANELSSRG
jgi:SAM-dependent methyltransferase